MSFALNEQQVKAVNHTSGPLLVVAGPGSGKTRVIVEKVLHLVKTGSEQSSILCLTFTEKAAGEMKNRLEKKGILDAKVNTFHSFAKEILEDNFIESGLGRSTKIFKKSSQMVWCIKNTDKFDFNSEHIELGNNQVRIYSAILEAVSNFKEEMISPDQVQKYVKTNLDRLNSEDNENIEIQKQMKFFNKLNEFNKVYRKYEEYRKEKELIDFDDMITKAIELLQKDPVILSNYQEKFQYILVDEFQDNNFSQLELVKLLGKHGNITAVGDDDQCIMKFQGAYFGIFQDFESTYPCDKVELSRNYRSNQNIVNLANQLLDPIQKRVKKSLFSEEEEGDPVTVIRTPTDDGEVEYTVQCIQKLLDKPLKRRDGTTKPITYKDIAILSRRKIEGQKFAKTLKSFGIPATFVGESNIFSSPVILDLLSFLKIANSPSSSGAELFRLMKSHGISERNIAVITNAAHKKARYVYDGQDDYVLEILRKFGEFKITQKTEIQELIEQIDNVIELSNRSMVSELVYKIMMSYSDIYKKSLNSEKASDKKNLILLNKFYEIAQEYQDIYPEQPLSDFIEHVSILGEFDIEIEDLDFEDTVNVLTLHKSKGKEFPIVFVTDLAEKRFPSSYKERTFHVPEELMKGVDRTIESAQYHLEEERRLFYVGMTRAMNMLFLLYPKKYAGNVNEKNPSQFLLELDYENNPLIKIVDFEESDSMDMQSEDVIDRVKSDLQKEAASAINQLHLKTAIHRIIELSRVKHFEKFGNFDEFDSQSVLKINIDDVDLTAELVGEKIPLFNKEELTLSPSSITAYDDCPLKFKFQKILRVPQPSSVALDLGSVVHAVTEEMANEKTEGETVTEEKALTKLKDKWIFRSYQNQTDENTAMDRAKQMIGTYVKWEEDTKNELIGTEIPFEVKIGEITFTGRIDRLEKNSTTGKYEVVDFKSGKSVKSKNKARIDPQLNIYAKAVEKIKGELPGKASLFYVEKDKMVEYEITEESVKEAIEPIIEMTKGILDEKFEPTPSHKACLFCFYQSICDAKIMEE
jgi:DNA helicase II / ATP-dependent DNA helicase PcrA